MENYIKLRQKPIDGVLTINKNINMRDIKSIHINNIKMEDLNREYDIYASDYEDLICDIVIELKKPINCCRLFFNCDDIITIDLSKFDTSKVTDMSGMFSRCSKLTSIEFSDNFDTSKVTDMNNMFYYCSGLTELDLSSFDTSNVINMSSMFNNCSSLTSLDLNHFDTFNVEDFMHMFWNCNNLITLDISNFNINKENTFIKNMIKCDKLKTLNIKNIKINENNKYLPNFLENIKNIQNIVINPKNNLSLYRKLKEVKYK